MPIDIPDFSSFAVTPPRKLVNVPIIIGSNTVTITPPFGCHGLAFLSTDANSRIGIVSITGHTTGDLYYSAAPGAGAGTLLASSELVIPVAVAPELDAQLDIVIQRTAGVGGSSVDIAAVFDIIAVFGTALPAPMNLAQVGGLVYNLGPQAPAGSLSVVQSTTAFPPYWAAPTNSSGEHDATGATAPVVAGVAGQVIRVFGGSLTVTTPAAGGRAVLQDTSANALVWVPADTKTVVPFSLAGLPLAAGAGLQLLASAGVTAVVNTGYSQV